MDLGPASRFSVGKDRLITTGPGNTKPGPETGSDRALLISLSLAPRVEDSGQVSLSGLEGIATSLRVRHGLSTNVVDRV